MMHVIIHKTIGKQFGSVFFDIVGQKLKIERSILITEENILPMAAPLGNVVRLAWNDYAWAT